MLNPEGQVPEGQVPVISVSVNSGVEGVILPECKPESCFIKGFTEIILASCTVNTIE